MDRRIEQLRSWLAERDEAVIVLVGHGQFFKHCLNRGFVQANVSVLECSFSARSGFTLLAELHPAAEVAAQAAKIDEMVQLRRSYWSQLRIRTPSDDHILCPPSRYFHYLSKLHLLPMFQILMRLSWSHQSSWRSIS